MATDVDTDMATDMVMETVAHGLVSVSSVAAQSCLHLFITPRRQCTTPRSRPITLRRSTLLLRLTITHRPRRGRTLGLASSWLALFEIARGFWLIVESAKMIELGETSRGPNNSSSRP